MKTLALLCLMATASLATTEDRTPLRVPEQTTSGQAIRDSFTGRFGTVRILHSNDKNYLVAAHDTASGIIREDTYTYAKNDNTWILIGITRHAARAAASIALQENTLAILDAAGKPIARYDLR